MRVARPAKVPTVGMVSLGCPKALVDSEQILTQLRAEGYQISPSYEGADLVVVNTCGFIDSAVDESLEAIGEALSENGKVIVTGCLGKREENGANLIQQRFPQVLAVTGPHDKEAVMASVHAHLPRPHDPYVDLIPPGGFKLTPRHYAYLKISEGCNHRCTFCIIPSLRGDLVSRPLADVMQEAQNLVRSGVRELLVVSQDTSAYGVDLRYRTGFWQGRPLKTRIAELVTALGSLGAWVRLHYVYPYPHVDQLIPLMQEGNVLPYLDIPFQHASRRILRLMKRPADSADVLERIAAWRRALPQLAIRSTFIVGFPGETDAEFEELLAFLSAAELDRVGVFAYSPVAGAAANDLPDPVPEPVKEARRRRLMQHQERISRRRLKRRIGSTCHVLVDRLAEGADKAPIAVGRSFGEAPEIDGVVYVTGIDRSVRPGDLIAVRIASTQAHDLVAEAVRAHA
jgi:ribosomal protein S12 methylthiotransferase